jgi:hypothetical protein
MRDGGLDSLTYAISINGMNVIQSHLFVSDEYIYTSTCVVFVDIQTTNEFLV